MKIRYFVLIVIVALFVGACKKNVKTPEFKIPVMAYYVPEKNYDASTIPVEQLTHILFSFTNVIDGKMAFRDTANHARLDQLVDQKERNPDLKVMIACGGWGAGGFSDMASTAENREHFIDSAIEFIKRHKLDGIDIDWEYPGMTGGGNKFRVEDKENFTLFMKELREALNATREGMLLTFAAAGWERYYNNVETLEVMKYADFINIMTYDLAGGGSRYTAHHTNLGAVSLQDIVGTPYHGFIEEMSEQFAERGYTYTARGADAITKFVLEIGVDPSQIVIGGAFYGRAWKGVPPDNNGLYQPNRGVHTGWMAYQTIRPEYENKNGFTRYWDEVAKAPYLYNPSDSVFISYDDTMSVRLKTEYCLNNSLGGIMFWQLGNDTKEENGLLDAMYIAATK